MKYLYLIMLSTAAAMCTSTPQRSTFKAHLSDGWYPKDAGRLTSLIEQAEQQTLTMCTTQYRTPEPMIKAIVVPHAGYSYAADIAIAAYRLLDKASIKRVIILAPAHAVSFQGAVLPPFDDYETPLGKINIDTAVVKKLQQQPFFTSDKTQWQTEHSVEVQLPYIQHYLGNATMIIPILIGAGNDALLQSIAHSLIPLLDAQTIIIISSDFIHYGTRFNYTPFAQTADVQAQIKDLDMRIINTLVHEDSTHMETVLHRSQATVCGKMPLILFKVLQQQLPYPLTGSLLCYKTSYAVDKADPTTSVSYASIIFKQQKDNGLSTIDKKRILQTIRDTIAQSCNSASATKILPLDDIKQLHAKQGLFVTLRTKDGQLRGCMGNVITTKPLILLLPEIARLAAFGDPRFAPVQCKELATITIEASILSEPSPVKSYKDIILGTHGIILTQKNKSALFLPQVATEQGWNLETTLSELAQKAGLPADAWKSPDATFQVFTALVFAE